MGKEALKQQANGRHEVFEKIIVDSASQNQIKGSNTDKNRYAVHKAVIAVENRMLDVILTTMNKMIIPQVEMAVRSILGSLGTGPNSKLQNFDRRDFRGNTEIIPLSSTSSRFDLSTEQDETYETRDIDNCREGNFPATRHNYDRKAHAHHRNIIVFTLSQSKK